VSGIDQNFSMDRYGRYPGNQTNRVYKGRGLGTLENMLDARLGKPRLERHKMFKQKRLHLHKRVRKTVMVVLSGPRLSVYRSGSIFMLKLLMK